MYSFLEVAISYHDRAMELSTWLEFQLKDRVLKDYFVIIGGEAEKERLLLTGAETQNLVRIVTNPTPKFHTTALPRGFIPVLPYSEHHLTSETEKKSNTGDHYNTNGTKTGDDDENQPNFVPRQNLFGWCPPHHNIVYAYKYPSSPGGASRLSLLIVAVEPFEPTSNWDRRAFFKPILERIFAQQIYASVIRALVACQKDENEDPVCRFSKNDVEWLSRTFTREGIGAQEEAYVCMFPAYDHTKDAPAASHIEKLRQDRKNNLQKLTEMAKTERNMCHKENSLTGFLNYH
jgi:hypothetical protein